MNKRYNDYWLTGIKDPTCGLILGFVFSEIVARGVVVVVTSYRLSTDLVRFVHPKSLKPKQVWGKGKTRFMLVFSVYGLLSP